MPKIKQSLSRAGEAGVYVDSHKPTPKVLNTSIPCPDCGAEVGQGCITESGKATAHRSRARMALRAGNVHRKEEKTRVEPTVGVTCPVCSHKVRTLSRAAVLPLVDVRSMPDSSVLGNRIAKHGPDGQGKAKARQPLVACAGSFTVLPGGLTLDILRVHTGDTPRTTDQGAHHERVPADRLSRQGPRGRTDRSVPQHHVPDVPCRSLFALRARLHAWGTQRPVHPDLREGTFHDHLSAVR